MEDQLIEYSTAKLAREKGFNWQCKKVWYLGMGGPRASTYAHEVRNNELTTSGPAHCTAPTQSLLQRWLREECGYHIQVEFYEDDTWGATIVLPTELVEHPTPAHLSDYYGSTYEQALEVALQQTLYAYV